MHDEFIEPKDTSGHIGNLPGIGHPSCVFGRRPSTGRYVKSRYGPGTSFTRKDALSPSRRVALSRRLRWVLLELYQSHQQHPAPREFVLAGVDDSNFRKREWRRILKRAKIGHRALKDLRDTFASQLLTAGVQLGYVSSQLGHADVAVTARHYARWIEGDRYRQPMVMEGDEVPADLLARLGDPTSDPSTHSSVDLETEKAPQVRAMPREIVERETGVEPATLSLGRRKGPQK